MTIGADIKRGDTTYHGHAPVPERHQDHGAGHPGVLVERRHDHGGQRARRQQAVQYQQKFGFGQPTGEGLPDESGGLVQPPSQWSGSSYGSIPIGMGISVDAAADDGRLRRDRQQRRLRAATPGQGDHRAGRQDRPRRRRRKRTRSSRPQTAADAADRRFEAVTTAKGATGHRAAVTGYRVAGKTGTGLQVSERQIRVRARWSRSSAWRRPTTRST